MAEIEDLDPLDGAANPRWPEGQLPSTVNDGARETEGITARWYRDTNGSLVFGGTANALTVAANQALTAYYDGLEIWGRPTVNNTGPTTLDVDGLGAKKILFNGITELAPDDLKVDLPVGFVYSTSGDAGAGSWEPKSGALLADGSVSGDKIPDASIAEEKLSFPVDTTPTGVVDSYIGTTPPSGWLLLNGDTLGSAASGATQASDDYETLWKLIYDSMSDTEAPVSGGRTTRDADWTANKALTMPDARGRSVIGTGQGAGLSDRVNGITGGAEEHTLISSELPDPVSDGNTSFLVAAGSAARVVQDSAGTGGVILNAGGNQPHPIMNPFLALTMIVKY